MTIYEPFGLLTLSTELSSILGLPPIMLGNASLGGQSLMDLNKNFKSVFVYSDLVHPRPVGDSMVPLLRSLPPINKADDIVHHTFEKPHYIPLARFQFDTIEILLTTDKGKEISFINGHTIVTLHFRQRRLI